MVISFQAPASMSAAEVRAWVIERALLGRRALVLTVPDPSFGQGLRLRVELDEREAEAAEEELADLIMDMRLLGLRPAVLPAEKLQDR